MPKEKNIYIRISTIQHDIDPEPVVEEASASYMERGGSRYVCYRTPSSPAYDSGTTRTILSFDGTALEIRRSGAVNGTVSYISGKKTKTAMDLGFGIIDIENDTFSIKAVHCASDDNSDVIDDSVRNGLMSIQIDYDLYLNGECVSRCTTYVELRKF
ncbi:MAG: DUF1934 domain-containing protein [Lachnospiraceae bacterium]|nr:DUF1934 domain-containing protein [Lachnospiraceae bacterium]